MQTKKIKNRSLKFQKIHDNFYIVRFDLKKNTNQNKKVNKDLILQDYQVPFGSILMSKVKKNEKKKILFLKKNDFLQLSINKKFINYYKIKIKPKNKLDKIIKKIEFTRKRNNLNWMNILKLSFKSNPIETDKIFKRIHNSDKMINSLSKSLLHK